ncbi:MAG TPA: hypothetical protein VNJ07_03370 [Chitinophagales bacterium]|nr:hypothetical protein [Chitinophagales bacterium]
MNRSLLLPRPLLLTPIFGVISGTLLILYSIIPNGIGLSEDSISYLSAAHSLLDSGRMLDIDGTPFVAWAPLYSITIAVLEFLPVRIENALAVFSIAIYVLTVITSWMLIAKIMENAFFRIACLASLVFSFTLLQVFTVALSEAVLLLIVNAALLAASRENALDVKNALLIGLICSLAVLQRYAGIFLIVGFTIYFLQKRAATAFKTLTSSFLLLLFIALAPIAMWFVRNHTVADTLTGFRPSGTELFTKNVTVLAETITSWFLPVKIPLVIRLPLFLLTVFVFSRLYYRNDKRQTASIQLLAILPVTIFTYLLILVIAYLFFSFEEPRDRLLSPIFIPFSILAFYALEIISKRTIRFSVSAFICLWLAYPVARTFKHVHRWHLQGVDVYNKSFWKDSETIDWLKKNSLPMKIFSNDAAAIYYFTGKNSFRVPKGIYSFHDFYASVETGCLLVWWTNRDGYDLQPLRDKFLLNEVVRLKDGSVFTIHLPHTELFRMPPRPRDENKLKRQPHPCASRTNYSHPAF